MAADRVIRWTTAGAVAGVAAMASYEHAHALVRAHGEAGRLILHGTYVAANDAQILDRSTDQCDQYLIAVHQPISAYLAYAADTAGTAFQWLSKRNMRMLCILPKASFTVFTVLVIRR